MKIFLLILVNLIGLNKSFSQAVIETRVENDPNRIYAKVDTEASYPGGEEAWRKFVSKNLNTPFLADSIVKEGKYSVVVKFIVSKDGSLSDIYCETNSESAICREAVRIIKLSAKWIPARLGGRIVNAYRRQPLIIDVDH